MGDSSPETWNWVKGQETSGLCVSLVPNICPLFDKLINK
jgi:hypothetical protein